MKSFTTVQGTTVFIQENGTGKKDCAYLLLEIWQKDAYTFLKFPIAVGRTLDIAKSIADEHCVIGEESYLEIQPILLVE